MSHATEPARLRPLRRLSTLLYGRPGLLLGILLGPPLLWLGIIYVGSLLMLLSNAFFGLDEFSGQVRHELGLQISSPCYGRRTSTSSAVPSACRCW